MFKIQTLNKISNTGMTKLPPENYEFASDIPNPDAILLRSFKMHDMELGDNLKAIARAGAGVNNIPVEKCADKGIVVFNTPGANANAVKELVILGILMSSRKVIDGINWTNTLTDKGDEVPKLVEKGKSNFGGNEIKGKKLGIIGLGAIGVMVANAAEALGMEVYGYDPFISVEAAWGLSSTVKKAISIDSLIADVDYISLHVPLNDKTKGLMNASKFEIMKKGTRLLNFARGGLVNNEDLKKAIEDGVIANYISDFPDVDVLNNDAIIAIPHLGASTEESEDNCAVMAVDQVKDFLENGNIRNSVNFPECVLARSDRKRIVVANRNVPAMIGNITQILAEQKINIGDMINKSKGEYAYNIIDIDNETVSDADIAKIKDIEDVIMVRFIG